MSIYEENYLWTASLHVTSLSTSSETNSPPPVPTSYIRTFGVSNSATDGFDRYLDVTAPPLPQAESLDVYFPCNHEVVTRLATDIRPDAVSTTWKLELTVPSDSTVNMNWDVGDVPSEKTLTLTSGNTDVDMKGQNSIKFESGTYSLFITTNKSYDSQKTGDRGVSSGSGGSVASPESSQNIELKEISQRFITNGVRVQYAFKGDSNKVMYIEFDPKKSAGKTTAIIEILKGKSSLTPVEPNGQIYQHLNIWVGNSGFSTPDNLENAVVGFRVLKSWVDKNDIDENSICLNRFNEGKWDVLSTQKVGEDDLYLYFEANTPGFSPFAITGYTNEELDMVEEGNFLSIYKSNQKSKEDQRYDAVTSNEVGKESETDDKNAAGLNLVSKVILLACVCLFMSKRN